MILLIQRKVKLFCFFLSSYESEFHMYEKFWLHSSAYQSFIQRKCTRCTKASSVELSFPSVWTVFAHLFLSFSGRLPTSMPALKLYCAKISSPQGSGLFSIGNVNVIKAPKQLLAGNNFLKAVACISSLFYFSREMLVLWTYRKVSVKNSNAIFPDLLINL